MRIDRYRLEHLLLIAAQREVALKFALVKTAESIEKSLVAPLTLENLARLKELASDLRQMADAADLIDALPRPLTVASHAQQESVR